MPKGALGSKFEMATDGSSIDVFMLGVVLYKLLFKAMPFNRQFNIYYDYLKAEKYQEFWRLHRAELETRGMRGDPENIPLIQLLTLMLQHNPCNRPELMDIKHFEGLQVEGNEQQLTYDLKQKIREWIGD